MNKMKEFDKGLKNVNSYDFVLSNMCKYLFSIIGVMLIALYIPDSIPIMIGIYWLVFYAVYLHINPYLYTKNGEQKVSVYGIMRDIPINKKDYIKSRINHMIDYGKKVLICCIVGRIVVMWISDEFTLQNVTDSVLLIVCTIVLVVGMCMNEIYSSMKK